MKAGDIILVRGKGWFAERILAVATEIDNGEPAVVSHVGMFVCERHVVEALFTKGVVTSTYPQSFQGVEYIIASPLNLTEMERSLVALAALQFSARRYGTYGIALQAMDYLFKTRWFSRTLDLGYDYCSFCSYVVAHAFSDIKKYFGVDPASAMPDDIWDFVVGNPDKYSIETYTSGMKEWLLA